MMATIMAENAYTLEVVYSLFYQTIFKKYYSKIFLQDALLIKEYNYFHTAQYVLYYSF